jgi:peptidyl-prolyl cis-trans isomerase SurA
MRIAIHVPFLLALASLSGAAQRAVTIDRIAVIVGNRVIKASDIDRDIRVTAFLNRQKADSSSQTKKQSAERLIDQQLIRDEIATGNYRRPAESEVETLETQLVRDRFAGAASNLDKALAQYGLSHEQLDTQLLWQLTVLRFIDQRFRTGVYVSDDDLQKYVQQHQAALRKDNPGASQDALQAKAREILEGERINQNFTQWLEQKRMSTRIEYKQEAFT